MSKLMLEFTEKIRLVLTKAILRFLIIRLKHLDGIQ